MAKATRTLTTRYRSIFISDVHLGFRGAQAEFLLTFLRQTESDNLYLVGDIVDLWEMHRRRRVHWPDAHTAVIHEILRKAENGTRVIYVPGNHDEALRDYAGSEVRCVSVHREIVHETADGRRLLVFHGDEFDTVVQCGPLLTALGNHAYDTLLWLNRWVNRARRLLGFPYWSLAHAVKHRVANATDYIARFEHAAAREARRRGVDGVVCGHIHRAEIERIDGVLYTNCGDWVESCTALTEAADGHLALVHWSDAARVTLKRCDATPPRQAAA
ncbi:UDP-2,3-diacylglucosamine hydrolase [wastewater metagenome]|uniref:UDP-2,3-diacylglucosamine hydrolase n=2 Tax=unclassified sequences TaxID=12908 RepID=A0A5B8RC20_9ZZZZ|nr:MULTISPECIES: UDP-2,3-diacylglucosamine diphosphatase [Arhodomonas]MCS4505734.1 UDP-2,3-diacylglucosamine diphosphatase [Arhodomonas aquaeolei]QEA04325.1 UDP-2,3-diacylglucosamine hydrolase [uncultured organism]